MMSLGMGLTFVPLTLTAVHGLRAEDSGIGSGVLNTMQQVGGALGLATLSTVAHSATDNATAGLAKAQAAQSGRPTRAARRRRSSAGRSPRARPTRSWWAPVMMLGAAADRLVFLNVKHEELASDDGPRPSTSADRPRDPMQVRPASCQGA